MRLWRRRRKTSDSLEFSTAAQLPWAGACFLVVLIFFAILAAAGIELPPAGFPFLVPFLVGFVGLLIVGRLVDEPSAHIVERERGRELGVWFHRRPRSVRLDELVSVERDLEGIPSLTLTDVRGSTVAVPLGVWTDEDRLLDEIENAAAEAGAKGSVGSRVPIRKPPWILPLRVGLGVVTLLPIIVLANAYSEAGTEPVTPARMEETRGRTISPFTGSTACDVYVVPLDRPSEARAAELASVLGRFAPVATCQTTSYALAPVAADTNRKQLDVSFVLAELTKSFRAVWSDRPSTVLGITELDLFNSSNPDLRFVFGTSYGEAGQGFGAVSTARMGSGRARTRRLETMAVRYVGFRFFGLEASADTSSALFHTINGTDDLDRMQPRFSDPALTDAELRSARARFLASSGR